MSNLDDKTLPSKAKRKCPYFLQLKLHKEITYLFCIQHKYQILPCQFPSPSPLWATRLPCAQRCFVPARHGDLFLLFLFDFFFLFCLIYFYFICLFQLKCAIAPKMISGSCFSAHQKSSLKERRKGRIKGDRGPWQCQRVRTCIGDTCMGFSRKMGICTEGTCI